jgi:hypothetical protein
VHEFFEQQMKMMEKTLSAWHDMLAEPPWLKKQGMPLGESWRAWLAGLRSVSEVGTGAWKTFVDQGEEAFFKMLKESRNYSQSVESQLKENWEALKKAQKAQKDATEEFLQKLESLIVKKEEGD